MTLVLDTTSKLLEILIDAGGSAADIIFTSHWADYTSATPAFTPGEQDGASNGVTPVTVVAAPSSGSIRMAKVVSVYNNGTVAHTVTFRLNLGGGTTRVLCAPLVIQPGASSNLMALTEMGMTGFQTANISDEVAYTPTFSAGLGTVTSPEFTWKRIGDSIYIRGKCVVGTVVASVATISLPNGLTVDTTKQATVGIRGLGARNVASAGNGIVVIVTGGDSVMKLSTIANASPLPLTAQNGNTLFNNGETFSFWAMLPIQGWTALTSAAFSSLVLNTPYDQLSVNANAFATKTGNATLTSADLGTWCHFADGSAQSVTLPAASACPKGTKIALYNASTPSGTAPIMHTVTRAGSDNIVGASGNLTSVTLVSTNFCVLESDGVNLWYVRQSRWDTGWISGGANTVTAATSNPTKGTVSVDKCYWRRVGHDVMYRGEYRQTAAGSSGTGTYFWGIPGGFTLDGTYIDTNESYTGGYGFINTTNNASLDRILLICNGTTNKFQVVQAGATNWSSTFAKFGDTVVRFYFVGQAPVSGWAV